MFSFIRIIWRRRYRGLEGGRGYKRGGVGVSRGSYTELPPLPFRRAPIFTLRTAYYVTTLNDEVNCFPLTFVNFRKPSSEASALLGQRLSGTVILQYLLFNVSRGPLFPPSSCPSETERSSSTGEITLDIFSLVVIGRRCFAMQQMSWIPICSTSARSLTECVHLFP